MLNIKAKHRIGHRLLFSILLASSLVTLITTGFQLYLEYKRDIDIIKTRVQEIQDIHLQVLGAHLWEYDVDQIRLQLEGLLRLPDMEYLEIYSDSDVIIRVGHKESSNQMGYTFPIVYSNKGVDKTLAHLKIIASLDEVNDRMKERFLVVLGFQGIKTFLVSIFILFIIQYLITRHLNSMADYANKLDLDHLDHPLILNKNSIKQPDEIDIVVRSLNDMRLKLQNSYMDLESKNKELRRIDQLKDQFLANTSHELKTPLSGIIGMAETMMDNESDILSEENKYKLSLIVSSGRRLSHLINDILDFSKLKHQDISLNLQAIDIRSITDVILSLSSVLVPESKVKLINSVPQSLPLVKGDEIRVQQVFHNLIGNSIKFTKEGEIEISAETKHNFIKVAIRDSGIGIPAENLDKIFNSFEQTDGSMNREYAGTGLGLTISKRLIELHGGSISAQSVENLGTEITFTLPIEKNAKLSTNHKTKAFQGLSLTALKTNEKLLLRKNIEHQNKSPYYILVVDDDLMIQQVLENYLIRENFNVQSASSGEECLKSIQKRKPDVILLDVMMPFMNGFDVCRKIREIYTSQELSVILLSARNQISDRLLGMSVGANDYLEKPVYKHELIARIQNQIQILVANRRVASYLEFSRQIGEFKDTKALVIGAFKQIEKNIYFNAGLVWQSGVVIAESGSDELVSYFTNAYSQHSTHQKNFKPFNLGDPHPGMLIHSLIEDFEEYRICIFRSKLNGEFPESALLYLNNIIGEVHSIRSNILKLTANDLPYEAINTIKCELDRIIFIKSISPFCEIVTDSGSHRLEVPISMQEIEMYFTDDSLFRVHRKYFINPEKVQTIRKKNPKDYELIFANTIVPIGRTYLKRFKARHSYFFTP
jgi:signal transduction histidine kinase/DNA-binding LytR/AlgR family response regulator